MTTINVTNADRDADMPTFVRRSEALRHYWRNDLGARLDLNRATEADYRRALVRQLERRYEARFR